MNIKNIIFDLGGVVLDIDYKKTEEEFKKLGVHNLESVFTLTAQVELFNNFDCGLITPADFRNSLRTYLNMNLSDSEIDIAWNALLLEWNMERMNLLDDLRKNYRIFLLSNTNIIHSRIYNDKLIKLTGGRDLKSYFEKVYYSYEVGLRKPNSAIFNLVLSENGLNLSETLFIDDTLEHINSARELGLLTYNIKPAQGETMLDIFK